MASQSNSDMWMGAASSDMSMLSNPVLELEEGSSWKTPASSQNTTNNMDVKDNVATPNFSKGLLEEEWYTPESSLMELSSYSSSPYGMSDPRSGFGLLESSLNFDNTNNLITGFRSAPSTICMDDLACTGQGSSVGLFSGISQGGQQQLSRSVPMDNSFSSGLPTSFNNQGIINPNGTLISNMNNSMRTNFPPYSNNPYSALRQDNSNGKQRASDSPRNHELTPYPNNNNNNKRIENNNNNKRIDDNNNKRTDNNNRIDNNNKKRIDNSFLQGHQTSDSSMDKVGSPQLQNEMDPSLDEYDVKDDDDLDESGDGSGGPYEVEEGAGNGVSELGHHGKGKAGKRGLPAKNLMAERRRRKKLNDRLYMLRSVVPKITKMDRASILGDAIEYLKELLQRINDIHNELEAAKLEQSRSMPSSPIAGRTQLQLQGYPAAAVKEECPVLPNPENQPPRVEVRQRDQALNIHMFCARRPGLLLSTVRALDALGLDVQQAVISCFNGFALDLFRAEAKDVDVGPDEIKAVLLLTAGCGGHSLQ